MSTPGPESPVVLSLGGASRAFGAVQALRDVSFDCRAGEVHALVGENGSGKSTLLGVASGVPAPPPGEIEIGGGRRAGAGGPRRPAGAPRRGSKTGPRDRLPDLLSHRRPVGSREPLPQCPARRA